MIRGKRLTRYQIQSRWWRDGKRLDGLGYLTMTVVGANFTGKPFEIEGTLRR
jgi:hypothetical protein